MQKLFLLLLFPFTCFGQNQSPSTYPAYYITNTQYVATTHDSTYKMADTGCVVLLAHSLQVGGVVYAITGSDELIQDGDNDYWQTLTLNGSTACILHRSPNYFLHEIIIGDDTYYLR